MEVQVYYLLVIGQAVAFMLSELNLHFSQYILLLGVLNVF